jgi:tetratricopeptide (TPR) repeat protein
MRTALLFAMLFLALACGHSDPRALTDAGASALASGDSAKALASFEEALTSLKPGDAEYVRASLGRFQALVRSEPERARDEFLAFAKVQAASLAESHYGILVNEFLRRGRTVEAIDVMDAGVKAFPNSEAMLAIRKRVEEQARSSKDPASMQKLKGLGYVGDK